MHSHREPSIYVGYPAPSRVLMSTESLDKSDQISASNGIVPLDLSDMETLSIANEAPFRAYQEPPNAITIGKK